MKKNMILIFFLMISTHCFGAPLAAPRVDNTEVNQRDSYSNELTADNQNSDSSDIEITRRIRREITKEDRLSFYAHNIKVITVNGKVTLKGPVRSMREQKRILKSAHLVVGTKNVKNEMSIAAE
jgi:hyperosmotically inducible periplasmic protein